MNIIVIPCFMRKDGANGLNWKSANPPDDNRKECKEMIWRIVGKEVILLNDSCFVCVLLMKLIKLLFKEDNLYQTAFAEKQENTLKVAAKKTLIGRFSSSFYRKMSFHTTKLHPLE